MRLSLQTIRDISFFCLLFIMLGFIHEQHQKLHLLESLIFTENKAHTDALKSIQSQINEQTLALQKLHDATQTQLNNQHKALMELITKNRLMNQDLEAKIEAQQYDPIQQPEPSYNKPKKSQASQYRIFGLQRYGMVIKTPSGYKIARIGQPLENLGVVNLITPDEVIVGNYVIRR